MSEVPMYVGSRSQNVRTRTGIGAYMFSNQHLRVAST